MQLIRVSFRRSFGRSTMATKVYVSEVDKLKAELRERTESFENLKKSHDAQADEINKAKLLCEDLRRDLENKESIIKHIGSANDKLRETYEERLKTLEDEKRALILELEEAKEKAYLSIPMKTCLESEKSLKAANEDEKFHKLVEEENRMKEELVTWKKEQLENLEEAHVDVEQQEKKINNANEDPELGTYALLDDISSLQIKLYSQTKTLEQLERELHMSKQALAREESIRKQRETQLSEYKVQFNNATDNQELEPNKGSLDSSIIDEMKLENEELSVMLLVLQQAISEAQAMDKGDKNEESELEIYKEKLEEAYDALDKAVVELDELIYEGSELECEVETWKSACERLKNDLEESHAKRKELEASLLSQVTYGESLKQERRVDEKQVKEAENERVKFLEIIEEKDKILKVLQKEIEWLEQEAFRREFESAVVAKSLTEQTNDHVKDEFIQLMNERKMRMDEIMQQMTSLEEHFSNALTTFSSLHEDEDEVPDSEAEAILQKLKNENNRLMEKAQRLSSEREHLLDYFLGLGDKICEFSTVDSELMDMVGSMVGSFENRDGDDDYDDNESIVSEKMIEHPATGIKNIEAISI